MKYTTFKNVLRAHGFRLASVLVNEVNNMASASVVRVSGSVPACFSFSSRINDDDAFSSLFTVFLDEIL